MNMARKSSKTFDVFVGNLPQDATEKNVGKLFTPFGEIGGIIVKESSKVKPPYNKFAFVKFLCQPDAEKAVREMDRKNIQGSEIAVKISEDRRGPRGDDRSKGPTSRHSDTDSVDGGGGGGGFGAPSMQDQNEKQTVMVTHVESPITLWLQEVNDENTKTIFSITEQLLQFCPSASPLTGQPEPGKVYACLYTEDNTWYRCQVRQCFGTDKYKIQYIDYGNIEEVGAGSLVEIPASLSSFRPLATKIVLHNTRAKDLSDKQGIQLLKTLTDNQMAQLIKTRPLSDGTGFYGNVFVNDTSLGDAMLTSGYCIVNPKMGKKGPGLQQGQLNRPSDNWDYKGPEGPVMNSKDSYVDITPGPPMMKLGQFNRPDRGGGIMGQRNTGPHMGGGGGNVLPLGMGHHSNNMSSVMGQPVPPQQQQQNMGFPAKIGHPQDSGREKKLQTDLTKKRQENDRLRNEMDATNMQLEYMKSKVKTLQEEFAATAAKLREDTLSKRILTVVSLAAVVRKLRDQFPTGERLCLLEEAIQVCTSSARVDNSSCSLTEVGSALSRYKAAQDEISKCTSQGELPELITARDEARRELHTKLTSCLERMEKMPLTERGAQLQDLEQRLSSTYGDFLNIPVQDCPTLETVAPKFKPWKNKKDQEFGDVRTATDFSEEALQTALSLVKDRMSVSKSSSGDHSDVDVDELMKTYAHALQREINSTNLAHSKDASLVAMVIASFRKELQNEAATLQNFMLLRQEFVNKKETIEPWLNTTPTFADVTESRKQLRALKSKLRHLQADKLDLEESGDESELNSLKMEELEVRKHLQAALLQSESQLFEVASVAETNFPELLVQNHDLGIDSFMKYNGLVKGARDIDHYQLLMDLKPGVHISSFNEEDVLITEYHIGGTDHCSKEEFLQQVVQYNTEEGPIQAVFFNKTERLAYIQTSWQGGELADVVIKDRELPPLALQQISIAVVREAAFIHARGCVHGEISPQTVIIREDNSICVLLPDFSKKLSDRISRRHVTDSGIVFQSPELQFTSPETMGPSADIYNVVLFIFWLHNPDGKPNQSSAARKKIPSLQFLFDSVLSGKSASRVTADQILQLDYFSKPLEERGLSPSPPCPAPQEPVVAMTIPQEPFLRSTDEPMEIGVFNAEDYMMDTAMLPPGPAIPLLTESDNSWTTESSQSATNSSRDSPLDTITEAARSISQQTVTPDGVDLLTVEIQTLSTDTISGMDNGLEGDESEGLVREQDIDPPVVDAATETETNDLVDVGAFSAYDGVVVSNPYVQEVVCVSEPSETGGQDVNNVEEVPTAKGAACAGVESLEENC
ncbi:serine/threonine-protein kinase 31-like [Mya arenaria]|nr:serine/threonine-protein kinase 31-like [Mya arenaria]